jgi:hypothetical protein
MKIHALNLLRYPRPARWIDPGVWRPALWGVVLGGLAGAGWAAWQTQRQAQWQQEREVLQARLQDQAQRQQAVQQAQEGQRMRSRLQARAQAWQHQQQQRLQMQTELSGLALQQGFRLQRWQGDGRKLALQLWWPDAVQAQTQVPTLVAQLSQASAWSWQLQSLGERAQASGMDVALEAVAVAAWAGASSPEGGKP